MRPTVKYLRSPLSILLILPVSLALADDIKTNYGKEYRNATVTRVEPDGITIKFSGGLVKIPFKDLSDELKQRYHYNPKEAQKFAADTAAQINANNAIAPSKQQDQNADKLLQQVMIFAVVKPFSFGEERTTADIQEYAKYQVPPLGAFQYEWRAVGKQFTGVIDEPMPRYYEEGDIIPVALYRIGHTNDSRRHPLFTTDKEKAMRVLSGN